MPEVIKQKQTLGERIEELNKNSKDPEFVKLARDLIRNATRAEANEYARQLGSLQLLIAVKTKFN